MRQIALACFYGMTCLLLQSVSGSLVAAEESEKVDRTRFYIASPNGENAKLFLVPGDFHNVGSPTFSADGQKLAFDGWKSQDGEKFADVRILVANADGSDLQVIGAGAMPSWSPGGKRIAFSQPPYGVVIMNADGSRHQVIDERGWGAQWSPDGRKIAYSINDAGQANIQIYDLIEETKSKLFPAGESPYISLYWNMKWSPDSNWLCFKGLKKSDRTYDVATINAAGMKEGYKVHYTTKTAPPFADFAWNPQGDTIIFGVPSKPPKLLKFNPAEDKPPEPVSTTVKGNVNGGVCFTPDGQHLLFTVRGEE